MSDRKTGHPVRKGFAWLGGGITAVVAFFGISLAASAQTEEARPNIVLILVDDAALMDFGAYGGEARTPNIDALVSRGAMFRRHYSSPLCSPSRAMLLTGMDNHMTGIATIPEVLPKEHVGQPGYTMHLEPGILTVADRLQAAGYRTLMSGKWHLGSGAGDLPNAHGFDRSLALDASGADNWAPKSYMPYYQKAPWYEDGQPADLPDSFYSSTMIVDHMIDYLDEGDQNQPFFAYVAFQAIHIPVQAPPELTAGYDGVYDQGWSALREARWQKAKEIGLIPQSAPLADMPDEMRTWTDLTPEDQALYAARMQVNAAMMEAMDIEIGRLAEHLKQTGQYDNTIFVVTSDNGPEPSRGDQDIRLSIWMKVHGYHIGMEGIGEEGSWGFIGPEWAIAAASPNNMFKFLGSEGGIRVPLVMAGPGVPEGEAFDTRTVVTDIAPTLLKYAGVEPTDGAIVGRSLDPLLSGAQQAVYQPDDAIGMEVSGNSAILKGRWKITRNQKPHGDGQWRLYDIEQDPGETADLSAEKPDVFADMLEEYEAYSKRVGVLEVPEGYSSLKEITRNTMARQFKAYWPQLLVLLFGVIALFSAFVYLMRRILRR
ncbi:arylsulfatase [uncultured Hyphomonas sp.]|uniref:arylsulfatase n=1 Tax=uncultured Hyphomonas sp. TaxID=225298 RepID=UPI002AAAED10|nr:arylsulfatase [uncultured Hyphomonas sp.]